MARKLKNDALQSEIGERAQNLSARMLYIVFASQNQWSR